MKKRNMEMRKMRAKLMIISTIYNIIEGDDAFKKTTSERKFI